MCQRNIAVASLAQATGLMPHAIASQHALTTRQELARIPILDALWEDLLKRLQQTDPELFLSAREAGHAPGQEAGVLSA
ncbi:MAG: hypothetical protein ACM3SW_03410 [Actinomycetota bacterium]